MGRKESNQTNKGEKGKQIVPEIILFTHAFPVSLLVPQVNFDLRQIHGVANEMEIWMKQQLYLTSFQFIIWFRNNHYDLGNLSHATK